MRIIFWFSLMSGQIIDHATGESLSGVQVIKNEEIHYTDINGYFVLDSMEFNDTIHFNQISYPDGTFVIKY